jgi:hypothetical protein
MQKILTPFLLLLFLSGTAQMPDKIYKPSIHSVKLFKYGDQLSYPILNLNSADQLELHFDDLDADVKSLYYTFQLCNADWTPAQLQPFDYIKGFQSTRITTYRNSSIALNRYTHYQATVPDKSSVPTRSGNYLLKVFRNNDTSDLFLTKRFLVVDNRVSIAAQMKQPFNSAYFLTDQRVMVTVSTANARINTTSPQDLKVVVMQNNTWPTAALLERPTIYRGNYFEYNDDASSFQAGREWRWIDLSSLRLMTDRMQRLNDDSIKNRADVYVKPDVERRQQVYIYYKDINGQWIMDNRDGYNPYWQSDYAYVHFTFIPPDRKPYAGKDIFLFGELTNYLPDDNSKMEFNETYGIYEKTLYLKQGYYNYSYITLDAGKRNTNRFPLDNTEGNFNNTENNYTVLVYFRPFGGRADELLGVAQLNSFLGR